MGIDGTEREEATEATILARLAAIEAKLDTLAGPVEEFAKSTTGIGLMLSQVVEQLRNQVKELGDYRDLIEREARATRRMIRLAPTSAAPLVAETERDN
jgi:hypothetical protein